MLSATFKTERFREANVTSSPGPGTEVQVVTAMSTWRQRMKHALKVRARYNNPAHCLKEGLKKFTLKSEFMDLT